MLRCCGRVFSTNVLSQLFGPGIRRRRRRCRAAHVTRVRACVLSIRMECILLHYIFTFTDSE